MKIQKIKDSILNHTNIIWAIFLVLLFTVSVVVSIVFLAVTYDDNYESDFDRFKRVCAEKGGFVANTSTSGWSTRYDCIKDNKVIYLEGFA